MNHDLYFIPILARAMRRPDSRPALARAFAEIKALGEQDEYADGYMQFKQWMNEVSQKSEAEKLLDDIAWKLVASLDRGDLNDDWAVRDRAVEFICSRPEWRSIYEHFTSDFEIDDERSAKITLMLKRNEVPIGSVQCTVSEKGIFHEITPGFHALELDSGRVIWEGELTERELLWLHAYPDHALELAASSGDETSKPTKEHSLLDGELVMSVFPGLESGRIVLIMKKPLRE